VGVSEILILIDHEIAQLHQARTLLGGTAAKSASPKTKVVSAIKKSAKRKKKRNLSPEGRKRIAEAVKRRWAKQKKTATSK
jgi:hypothetical protein